MKKINGSMHTPKLKDKKIGILSKINEIKYDKMHYVILYYKQCKQ